jgi:hypothetical protein
MNAPEVPTTLLPRYGIREDEMTRPCVVLYDWTDDEATVRVDPLGSSELGPGDDDDEEDEEDDDELEASLFGRRFRGIGRRPGAVALGLVLGLSVGIGVCALFAPGDAQAGAASTAVSLR